MVTHIPEIILVEEFEKIDKAELATRYSIENVSRVRCLVLNNHDREFEKVNDESMQFGEVRRLAFEMAQYCVK